MSKKINIQVWTDMYYCRIIAFWYPPATLENSDPAPFVLVTSSMFEPREEVMGINPIAPGQHPIPKDFLQQQLRHVSYMFANQFGIFQPPSKQLYATFIAKQTVGYSMIKELEMEVSAAHGSIKLGELKEILETYNLEELENIRVLTVGENPLDAHAKDIESAIHFSPDLKEERYFSMNIMMPVYEVEDIYIDNSQMPSDPITQSYPPGTAAAEIVQKELETTTNIILEDRINKEILSIIDASGGTIKTREEALTILLSKKEKKMIDGGISPAIIEPDPVESNSGGTFVQG